MGWSEVTKQSEQQPEHLAAEVLLNCVDDAIVVVDAALKLRFVNTAAAAVFADAGSQPREGSSGLALLHPEDIERVSAELAELLAVPGSRRVFSMQLRDGEQWFPVEATATNRLGVAGVDGIVVCFRHIAREMAQQQMADDLKVALDMSSDAVILHAADGTVRYANSAAREMIRFSDATHGWPYRPQITSALTEFVIPTARLEGRWSGDIDVRDAFGVLRCLSLAITTTDLDAVAGDETGSVLITARDVTARRTLEQEHAALAFRDELTALPNRAALNRHLDDLFAAPRPVRSVAALFVDLDRFKAVNDTLGHQCGDELLKMVAARLVTILRTGEMLARLGGDEFVIVVADDGLGTPTISARAVEIAQHALRVLTRPVMLAGSDLYLSASVGIAYNTETGCTAGELLRHADLAMFRAKNTGRSRTVEFSPSLAASAERHLHLEAALHRALENDELVVLYQPITRLDEQTQHGFEALVRWRGPDGTLHPPAVFLDVAEQSDLITRLDEFVLGQACRDLSSWIASAPPDYAVTVSVNVSSRQLCREDFAELVAETLVATGVPAPRLTIEVTENSLMSDLPSALQSVADLRDLGVGIAIDDFGTGYCSMNYLRLFKAGTLKIDPSFVAHVTDNAEDALVIGAITQLAEMFGMDTVAEGVETKEQLLLLESIGCSAAQGYLLDHPLASEVVLERLLIACESSVR